MEETNMSEEMKEEIMEETKEEVIREAKTDGEEAEKAEAQKVETMDDYAAELEASFKRVREGDVLTGTVMSVSEDAVLVDLKYYAEGIIHKEDISGDPDFLLVQEIHPGDEITATGISPDDGEGNILLSRKLATNLEAWEKLKTLLNDRTVINVKIAEIVKGGAVVWVEGIRGFIPASKLAAEYVENLEEYNGKTIEATVITADEENRKLVLSGREPALLKLKEEKSRKIAKCRVGAVMEGTVDSIKDYGAFINLDNGLSGLLHISQISSQRIKHPGAVLKEGQTVRVKIISISDNKISLSMKAVAEDEEAMEEVFDYKEEGSASTGLSSLLKGLKF